MLKDLAELIAIPSVQSDAKENKPFGDNVAAALDWFINKAKSYGLTAESVDGYAAYAEYGKGKKCIGILCHTDVVPAGDGWSYPPFQLTEDGGKLYGRGVVDNKGSVVIGLHILKALKDAAVKTKNRIRVIVGGGEENGSACMKHYSQVAELPKFNIIPDADFPIITSEKGIIHLTVSLPLEKAMADSLISFNSGSRPNVVPASAKIVIKKDSPLGKAICALANGKNSGEIILNPPLATNLLIGGYNLNDFSLNFLNDTIELTTVGKAGHAMCPEKGDNAAWKAIAFLNAFNDKVASRSIADVNLLIASPAAPERLYIDAYNEESGELTMNLGIVRLEKGNLVLELDFRLPTCSNKDEVIAKIEEAFPSAKVTEDYWAENLIVDETSPLVQTLLAVYEFKTGEKSFCVKTGGGTYARELPNSVAFGPTFPNMQTNIHDIDETISKEDFFKLYEIYYKAIEELDKL